MEHEAQTALLLAVAAVVGWFANTLSARRLGLGSVQVAVRRETAVLVEQLKTRVDLLDKENAELKSQVAALTAENRAQAKRIDHLEEALADQAIAKRARTGL